MNLHFINMLIASDCQKGWNACALTLTTVSEAHQWHPQYDFAAAELPHKHVHNKNMLQTEFAWIFKRHVWSKHKVYEMC